MTEKPDFMKIKLLERENIIMIDILRSLKKLGGVARKKEIVAEMKESSNTVPTEFIDYVKISKKSGNGYKPFDFNFNFATKHLVNADYLKYTPDVKMQLTSKGRKADLANFDPDELVRKISHPMMEASSKAKKAKAKETSIETELGEIVSAVEESENNWRQDLHDALEKMTPQKFEIFSRRLVKSMGVNLDENIGISYVADGGLDGFGYITSDDFRTTRVAIQAKRWKQYVGSPEIDKFRGAMDKFNAEFGVFITTSSFSRSAIEAARTGTRVITLIDGDAIADLVEKYELYVHPVTTYILEDFYTSED